VKLPSLKTKRVKVTLGMDFVPGEGLQALQAGLTKAQNPATIARLLRVVLAQSLKQAYDKRYAAVAGTLHKVEEVGATTSLTAKDFDNINIRRKLLKLGADIEELQDKVALGAEQGKRIGALQAEQAELLRKFVKSRSRTKHKGESKLGQAIVQQNEERQRRQDDVMRLLTDENRIKASIQTTGKVTVRMGERTKLEGVVTPSIADFLGKGRKQSRSLYKKLFLQMEFGSGVLRKPGPHLIGNSPYKDGVGSWWWGKKKGSGIQFLGNRPGNILRDSTGLMYGSDAQAMWTVFNRLMTKLIFGV
jgi:hypothetical protein